jgi:hypothetical protein
MPDNGTYLLTNVGFSKEEKPILVLQHDDTFISMQPIDLTFTMTFDQTQRYCVGWRDMTEGVRHTCPDRQTVLPKYEQCAACQTRTGFNPAFYHASSVSTQQEARNLEPHILYLAHFGAGVVKVGISHAKRGHARLLEQGAHSALILDELPSAHIARQYEAQIATLPGIAESIQLRKKMTLLATHYDHVAASKELNDIKQTIETKLAIKFSNNEILSLDSVYFPHAIPQLFEAHSMTDQHFISGLGAGMIGSLLFCQQQEELYYIALKKYVGYNVEIGNTVTPITTAPRQTSLF